MITDTQPRRVIAAVTDIRDTPGGNRLRQLLFGEPVIILQDGVDHQLIEAKRDGYRGYVPKADLGPAMAATHRVTVLATHLYTAPDIRTADVMSLSFGAKLTLKEPIGAFCETQEGFFVPSAHIQPVRRLFSDPAAVADQFLGTPYLWGGNSRLGIDCSGLVQAACLACGIACPGDSGDQATMLGQVLDPAAPLQRGDLLFWKGHVAMAVSADRMIHATAAYMSVVYEDIAEAIERIQSQGDGPVTARRRLPPLR